MVFEILLTKSEINKKLLYNVDRAHSVVRVSRNHIT